MFICLLLTGQFKNLIVVGFFALGKKLAKVIFHFLQIMVLL